MSKAKPKYLEAHIPEVKPKETPKRGGSGGDGGNGRIADVESAIAALNDLLAKQNRDNLDAMYNLDMGNMSTSMKRLFQSYDDGITRAEASIEAWVKEMEAGFRAVAEWESETSESLAKIEGTANQNGASIALLTQFQNETVDSLAQIKQESTAQKASIEQLTQFRTDTTDALTQIRQESTDQHSLIEQWAKFSTETSTALAEFREEVTDTYATNQLVAQYKDEESVARAALEQWVKNNYASNELVAKVETDLGENISAVTDKVTENESALAALTSTVSGNTTSIAGLTSTANSQGSAIASLQSEVQGENADGWLYKTISAVTTQANNNKSAISSLQSAVYTTDADGNQITALAKFQDEVSTIYAKASSLAEFQTSVSNSFATINQTAKDQGALIELVAYYGTDDNGDEVPVLNATSIALGVSKDEDFINLIASKVNVTGFVTFESLESDGGSYINGNNIGLVSDSTGDSTASLRFWLGDDIEADKDDFLIGEIYTSGTSSDLRDCEFWIQSGVSDMKIVSGRNLDMSSALAMSIESGESYVEIIANGSVEIYSGKDTVIDCDYITIIPAVSHNDNRNVDYAWQFFDDGIYYNGYRVVAIPS